MFYRETTKYYRRLEELRAGTAIEVEKPGKPLVEDERIKTMTKKQLKQLKKKLKKKKNKLKQKNNEIERQIVECENQMQAMDNSKANEQLNRSKSKAMEKSEEQRTEIHREEEDVQEKPEITRSNVELGTPKPVARARSLPIYNRSPSAKQEKLKNNLIHLKKKLEDDLKTIKLNGIEELVK